MDRLTTRTIDGFDVHRTVIIEPVKKSCCTDCNNDCDDCSFKKCILKLASYEDTGLSPAEVAELALYKTEHDNPQPLTLEQLKQRVGKPVWLETGEVTIGEQIIGRWVICKNIKENNFYVDDYSYMRLYNYSETWLTYDYQPKENDK